MIRTRFLVAALAASVTSATAEEPAPTVTPPADAARGGVAQLAFAHELHALAREEKDALLMVAAATLAGAVAIRQVDRTPETTGETAGETAGDWPDAAEAPADPAAMLAEARALSGEDELLATILDEAETANALTRRGAVLATPFTLAPGQTDTWALPFDGATLAEVAVLGDGDGNLDVTLADAGGAILCVERGPADRAHCAFTPAETGYFSLAITNNGPGVNSYLLLTN